MVAKPAERLAAAVRARRDQLDRSQLDVWQAGGPSNTTLTEVENGRMTTLSRVTARRLDQGLRWEPGSARRVWEGGEATPIEGAPGVLPAHLLAELEKLSPETREHVRQVLERDARRRERGTA